MSFSWDESYDGGVTNDTPPFTTAPPDASGGAGSFLPQLLGTLTNGISQIAAAKISANVRDTLGYGLATVDANGQVVYKGSPATPSPAQISPVYAAKSFFGSVAGMITLAGVGVLIVLAMRK